MMRSTKRLMRKSPVAIVGAVLTLALGACAVPGFEGDRNPAAGDTEATEASRQQAPDDNDPSTDGATTKESQRDHRVSAVAPKRYPDARAERVARLAENADSPLAAADSGYYMDLQEANLRQTLAGRKVPITRRDGQLVLSLAGPWDFATGATTVSPPTRDLLAAIAGVLVQYPQTLVAIHGYTDATGPDRLNRRLSRQRARNIARHLLSAGVGAERMLVIGHGEATDKTPARRTDIHLEPVVTP